jgi:cellobiose-specific phosphotransferase system component IIC
MCRVTVTLAQLHFQLELNIHMAAGRDGAMMVMRVMMVGGL